MTTAPHRVAGLRRLPQEVAPLRPSGPCGAAPCCRVAQVATGSGPTAPLRPLRCGTRHVIVGLRGWPPRRPLHAPPTHDKTGAARPLPCHPCISTLLETFTIFQTDNGHERPQTHVCLSAYTANCVGFRCRGEPFFKHYKYTYMFSGVGHL